MEGGMLFQVTVDQPTDPISTTPHKPHTTHVGAHQGLRRPPCPCGPGPAPEPGRGGGPPPQRDGPLRGDPGAFIVWVFVVVFVFFLGPLGFGAWARRRGSTQNWFPIHAHKHQHQPIIITTHCTGIGQAEPRLRHVTRWLLGTTTHGALLLPPPSPPSSAGLSTGNNSVVMDVYMYV